MSILDSITNYNEQLVLDELQKQLGDRTIDEGTYSDIMCIALNNLPSKYIRHSVDCAYYLGDSERSALDDKVKKAVTEALAYIDAQK